MGHATALSFGLPPGALGWGQKVMLKGMMHFGLKGTKILNVVMLHINLRGKKYRLT